MSEQAVRIGLFKEIDDQKICYWRQDGIWYLYLPGCGIGNLSGHQVTEFEDGTITVSPSIKMTGHCKGQPTIRHGYLERGVWKEG